MSLTVVEAVRRQWPDVRLGFLVESPHEQLLEADARIDRIHVFDKQRWMAAGIGTALGEFWRLVRQLRSEKYEVIADLHGVPRSQWMARLAGGRRRVGRASGYWHDVLIHERTKVEWSGKHNKHNLEWLLEIVAPLGVRREITPPKLSVSKQARLKARQWLQDRGLAGQPLIGLHPGSISQKKWPTEQYIELGRLIKGQLGAKVVITAGPGEEALAEAIAEAIGREDAQVAALSHLLEVAALLETCSVFVGGDTGPMHMAAAVGTPVVAVFMDPSNPYRSGPVGPNHFVLFKGFDYSLRRPFEADRSFASFFDTATPADVCQQLQQVCAKAKRAPGSSREEVA